MVKARLQHDLPDLLFPDLSTAIPLFASLVLPLLSLGMSAACSLDTSI